MAIAAIATEYNGYKFRSRLEARWAVFFDALGIQYEYENEGYQLQDGTKYLPDFLLHINRRHYEDDPDAGLLWAEVKGEMNETDAHKIELFSCEKPLIVLGNVPKDQTEYWEDATDPDEYGVWYYSYNTIDGDSCQAFFSVYKDEPWICGGDHEQWDQGKAMDAALQVARQVRFEHGETPEPKEVRRRWHEQLQEDRIKDVHRYKKETQENTWPFSYKKEEFENLYSELVSQEESFKEILNKALEKYEIHDLLKRLCECIRYKNKVAKDTKNWEISFELIQLTCMRNEIAKKVEEQEPSKKGWNARIGEIEEQLFKKGLRL